MVGTPHDLGGWPPGPSSSLSPSVLPVKLAPVDIMEVSLSLGLIRLHSASNRNIKKGKVIQASACSLFEHQPFAVPMCVYNKYFQNEKKKKGQFPPSNVLFKIRGLYSGKCFWERVVYAKTANEELHISDYPLSCN